jgi:hypothetical protein
VQWDAMLGSLLRRLEFDLSRDVDSFLARDRRRRFQLSDQPVHVAFEFGGGPKSIDANGTKEMAARILIGVGIRDTGRC